jgi:hypothetical protein
VNGFLKEREALRDDLRHATCRTRLSSSHFLCCRSAISSVPYDQTVPSNEHADLIWSGLRRIEDLLPCIRVFAEPYLPWGVPATGPSVAATVLGASAVFITIMHMAPTPAQKTVRARRHNARVNPVVLVTPNILQ